MRAGNFIKKRGITQFCGSVLAEKIYKYIILQYLFHQTITIILQ